ncbi:MAG: TlpA family protein disulfide reductase [Streptomycetales bacterium]
MSTRTRHVLVVALVGALLAGSSVGAWGLLGRGGAPKEQTATLPALGRLIESARRPEMPVIAGRTLTGARLDVRELRGRVVVVNFWASWCAPCREEAPALRMLAQRLASRGVRFVGVNVRDNRTSAIAFERRYHIAYPSIFDPDYAVTAAMGPLTPRATPATYMIDRRGRIAAVFFGRITYKVVEPMLVSLAAEQRHNAASANESRAGVVL